MEVLRAASCLAVRKKPVSCSCLLVRDDLCSDLLFLFFAIEAMSMNYLQILKAVDLSLECGSEICNLLWH